MFTWPRFLVLLNFNSKLRNFWMLCILSITLGIIRILSFSCGSNGKAAIAHQSQEGPFGARSKWLSQGGIGPNAFSMQDFSSRGSVESHFFNIIWLTALRHLNWSIVSRSKMFAPSRHSTLATKQPSKTPRERTRNIRLGIARTDKFPSGQLSVAWISSNVPWSAKAFSASWVGAQTPNIREPHSIQRLTMLRAVGSWSINWIRWQGMGIEPTNIGIATVWSAPILKNKETQNGRLSLIKTEELFECPYII